MTKIQKNDNFVVTGCTSQKIAMDCNAEKESKFETKSLHKQKTSDQVSTLKIETTVTVHVFASFSYCVLCDHTCMGEGSSEKNCCR